MSESTWKLIFVICIYSVIIIHNVIHIFHDLFVIVCIPGFLIFALEADFSSVSNYFLNSTFLGVKEMRERERNMGAILGEREK